MHLSAHYSSKRRFPFSFMRPPSTKVSRPPFTLAIFDRRRSSKGSWAARKSARMNKHRFCFGSCAIRNMCDQIIGFCFAKAKAKAPASSLKCSRSINSSISREVELILRAIHHRRRIDNLLSSRCPIEQQQQQAKQ